MPLKRALAFRGTVAGHRLGSLEGGGGLARTEAHKGEQCTNLVGRPRRLGFGPANGWAALSKHFGGYLGSAPTGRVALPG